jgi:hypothetical protein
MTMIISPPPGLKARILAAASEVPSATRQSLRHATRFVLVASVLVDAAMYFALDGPAHGRGRPVGFTFASAGVWAAVAFASAWVVLGHGSSTGRACAWLVAVTCGTPAILFAVTSTLSAVFSQLHGQHVDRTGLDCLVLTLAAAGFPFVALLDIRRESDPVHPAATGAALGSACGAAGGTMVEMWCPIGAPTHVLIGHIGPLIALALLGAMLGRAVLAMKPPIVR